MHYYFTSPGNITKNISNIIKTSTKNSTNSIKNSSICNILLVFSLSNLNLPNS